MNALVHKLENYADLTDPEREALADATRPNARFQARVDIVRQGDRPAAVNLLLTGMAYRYKMLEDGRRQLLAVFVPGDFCDLRNFVLRRMDHSIAALTEITVAQLRPEIFDELIEGSRRLRDAFWWSQLLDESITREWVVNTGQRTALERTAHLMCELFWRLRAVGLTRRDACEFPFTQSELADALGISTVHLNRTLKELRRLDLIVLEGRELIIPDLEGLQAVALFNPDYLHLREGSQADPDWRQGRQSA